MQLGLTATPKRDANADTYAYFGDPVYTYALKEGIGDGFLTPFKVRQMASTLDTYTFSDEDEVVSGEIDPDREYTEADFNTRLVIDEREQSRVQEFMDQIDQRQKTLVFCATQDHAARVRNFINQVKDNPDPHYCERVTANDGKVGEQHLREFQDNEKTLPTILTTSHKLSTGVDARNVRNIVLLRPIKSMIEFKQIIGRGTRTFDGKDFFTIYDFVRAYEHFNDPEWDGEPLPPESRHRSLASPDGRQNRRPDGPTGPEDPPADREGGGQARRRQGTEDPLHRHDHLLVPRRSSDHRAGIHGSALRRSRHSGRFRRRAARRSGVIPIGARPSSSACRSSATTRTGSTTCGGSSTRRTATSSMSWRYVRFTLAPLARSQRAEAARTSGLGGYEAEMREFLNYVLRAYETHGVEELAPRKIADFLRIRYGGTNDAKRVLGSVGCHPRCLHWNSGTSVRGVRRRFFPTGSLALAKSSKEGTMTNEPSANGLISDELDLYSEVAEPGFAVLADAPWGAGKTYFVKKWMVVRKDAIYFSVYGVSTSAQLEAVLLEAIFDRDRSLQVPRMARALEEAAKHWSGITMGLSDMYRRIALRSAPRLLVIDDLERSNLSANEALGLINDYLEHQGKNVILLSHEEALRTKWGDDNGSYSDIKEKVVGRVLTLEPSVNEVVYAFASPAEKRNWIASAKSWMGLEHPKDDFLTFVSSETEFITSMFRASKSKNLRLLRQFLRDFGRNYPELRKIVKGDDEKLRTTLASYMALSIAYHQGRGFDASSLQQAVSWDQAEPDVDEGNSDEKPVAPLEALRRTYAGVREVRLDGLVISKELAVGAISKGILDAEFVRGELLKSPYLEPSQENSWRILWYWMRGKPEQVELALQNVLQELRKFEVREPVILLHVFCIFEDMEERGVDLEFGSTVQAYFKTYTSNLLDKGLLPAYRPKAKHSSSLVDQNDTGLGFLREDTEFFRIAVAHLEELLDRSFWNQLRFRPDKFADQFAQDPRSLMLSLDDRGHRGELAELCSYPRSWLHPG